MNQIISFPLKLLKTDILNLTEGSCGSDLMDTELIASEHCEAIPINFIAELPRTDLQDGLPYIFFNNQMLNIYLTSFCKLKKIQIRF